MRARFVSLEGLDGAGKTTHLERIVRQLESCDIGVCVTREPGGTPLGEALRNLLLDANQSLHPETEALLMFASRREHLEKIILPALEQGRWVLCDRFSDATFAYQGGGSGVAWEKIEALETWVQRGVQPDLTLYFDVTPDTGRARAGAVRTPDRFERERAAFHARTREAYLRRARENAGRVRVIDANRPLDIVQAEVEAIVGSLISNNDTPRAAAGQGPHA
jgi:dTMP kinase